MEVKDLIKFVQYGEQPAAIDLQYNYGKKNKVFRAHYETLTALLSYLREDLATKSIDPDDIVIDFVEVAYSLLDEHRYIKIYGHEVKEDESE